MADRLRDANTSPDNNLQDVAEVRRSVFNLSHVSSFTMDMGAIVPFYLEKVVPGDTFQLSNDILCISSNPLVKRMLASCKIYTHYYYNRANDLWAGWNNYITRGRSGKISLTLPRLGFSEANGVSAPSFYYVNSVDSLENGLCPCTPMSLPAYLGVPFAQYLVPSSDLSYNDPVYGSSTNDQSYRSFLTYRENGRAVHMYETYPDVNALPFAMYQRIYRDYYLNKNLMQDNENWFPVDEEDFILKYQPATGFYTAIGRNVPNGKIVCSPWVPRNLSGSFDYPALPFLRYRNWRTDDYTSGLPWQQRGDQINLFGDEDLSKLYATIADSNGSNATVQNGIEWSSERLNTAYRSRYNENVDYVSLAPNGRPSTPLQIYTDFSNLSLTANRVRELFVLSTWQERAARTNGDYNDRIFSEFHRNPKWRDRTAMYIGGTQQNLVFSEVLQTSEDGNTPLGTQAGRAVSAAAGNVGTFNVPDYGYIMGLVMIVPDVTYSQGLPRSLFGGISFADEYFPIFNNLAPEPILNKELYYTGDEAYDEDIFAWRERFSYMKSRSNRVAGLLALPPSVNADWASYTFARFFGDTSRPALNQAFVAMTPPTVRRDMFAVPNDPMFIVQIANGVRAVRPLPYSAKPANLTGYAM